ncbi:MAG: hypothetical protein LBU39_11140, partial [Desulfobulbaceae bacterium]|nr:hypothetical protein [Desulfobulbaceae bacterium]
FPHIIPKYFAAFYWQKHSHKKLTLPYYSNILQLFEENLFPFRHRLGFERGGFGDEYLANRRESLHERHRQNYRLFKNHHRQAAGCRLSDSARANREHTETVA